MLSLYSILHKLGIVYGVRSVVGAAARFLCTWATRDESKRTGIAVCFVQFNTRAGAHCKAGLCRRLTQPPKRQSSWVRSAKTMIRGRLCHSLRRWRRVMGACGGGQSRGIHELDELDEQPRQPRAERQEHEGARGFRTAALARCTASHRYPRWELFGVCPMVEKSPRR